MKGVSIANNVIVATGSVVTRSAEESVCVVSGSAFEPLKQRNHFVSMI